MEEEKNIALNVTYASFYFNFHLPSLRSKSYLSIGIQKCNKQTESISLSERMLQQGWMKK